MENKVKGEPKKASFGTFKGKILVNHVPACQDNDYGIGLNEVGGKSWKNFR